MNIIWGRLTQGAQMNHFPGQQAVPVEVVRMNNEKEWMEHLNGVRKLRRLYALCKIREQMFF